MWGLVFTERRISHRVSCELRMTVCNMLGTGRWQMLVALGWLILFVTRSGAGETCHLLYVMIPFI